MDLQNGLNRQISSCRRLFDIVFGAVCCMENIVGRIYLKMQLVVLLGSQTPKLPVFFYQGLNQLISVFPNQVTQLYSRLGENFEPKVPKMPLLLTFSILKQNRSRLPVGLFHHDCNGKVLLLRGF